MCFYRLCFSRKIIYLRQAGIGAKRVRFKNEIKKASMSIKSTSQPLGFSQNFSLNSLGEEGRLQHPRAPNEWDTPTPMVFDHCS